MGLSGQWPGNSPTIRSMQISKSGRCHWEGLPRCNSKGQDFIKTCKLLTDEAQSYWFPWNNDIYHNTCISSLCLCLCDYINGDWTLCWRWEAIMKASFAFCDLCFWAASVVRHKPKRSGHLPSFHMKEMEFIQQGHQRWYFLKSLSFSYSNGTFSPTATNAIMTHHWPPTNFGDLWIKSGPRLGRHLLGITHIHPPGPWSR